jgi:hypothetical protein
MDRTAYLLISGLLLAGCATAPSESPEQATVRHVLSCADAGFTRDTEAWRLCLLIQQQNDRLAAMEGRLRRIELQSGFGFGPYPYGWRWY